MLHKIEKYKTKINNLLQHNTYSKKAPLNTLTTKRLLNYFSFELDKTYVEINSLEKKDKDNILLDFNELIKIKDYKGYFDIIFKLDSNIDSVLNTIDEYKPESITIYNVIDLKEFEKYSKKNEIKPELYSFKININLELQRITIVYKKELKEISKSIKEMNKLFE